MTEHQWNICTDPATMLVFLRANDTASERKIRLYAVACCRRIWPVLTQEPSRSAVEAMSRYADGEVSDQELDAAHVAAQQAYWTIATGQDGRTKALITAATAAFDVSDREGGRFDRAGVHLSERAGTWQAAMNASRRAAQAVARTRGYDVERHAQSRLLRDVFGPLPFRDVRLDPAWLAWNAGTVRRLAEAAYEEREMPSGHLDQARLGVLADALQEAGCGDQEILGHLRGPGPHVRGCYVIDLLLNRA